MTAAVDDKRKKLGNIALIVLGSAALYSVYSTFFSGPPGAPPDTSSRATTSAPAIPAVIDQPGPKRSAPRSRSEEFHPVLHSKRPEDRIDPMKVDPTLHLDLLSKVMGVALAGGSRNLFAFAPAPPPKVEAALKGPEPRLPMGPFPVAPPPPKPGPAPEAPPPPITLQFYGYSMVRNNGKKLAYFLDGDCKSIGDPTCEILIASEGDTLKKRYKLVRISAGSVLMEDTVSKRQQNLPMTAEAPSS